MALLSFFKTNKPRQFDFSPRYYNAQKEALQQRVERIEAEVNATNSDAPRRTLTKGMLTDRIERRRSQQRKVTLRLVLIIVALVAIAYYLLYR